MRRKARVELDWLCGNYLVSLSFRHTSNTDLVLAVLYTGLDLPTLPWVTSYRKSRCKSTEVCVVFDGYVRLFEKRLQSGAAQCNAGHFWNPVPDRSVYWADCSRVLSVLFCFWFVTCVLGRSVSVADQGFHVSAAHFLTSHLHYLTYTLFLAHYPLPPLRSAPSSHLRSCLSPSRLSCLLLLWYW